jgi:hypothetical protein
MGTLFAFSVLFDLKGTEGAMPESSLITAFDSASHPQLASRV